VPTRGEPPLCGSGKDLVYERQVPLRAPFTVLDGPAPPADLRRDPVLDAWMLNNVTVSPANWSPAPKEDETASLKLNVTVQDPGPVGIAFRVYAEYEHRYVSSCTVTGSTFTFVDWPSQERPASVNLLFVADPRSLREEKTEDVPIWGGALRFTGISVRESDTLSTADPQSRPTLVEPDALDLPTPSSAPALDPDD
jgi:hypothetical protein